MSRSILLVFYALLVIATAAQPKTQKVPKNGNKLRDAMKMLNLDASSFIRIKTKRNETNCERDIAAWLNDLKNGRPWAIDMWDVQPKVPSSLFQGNRIHIGDFDACLNITSPYNFTGQYCLLSINTTEKWLPDQVPSEELVRFPLASRGICIPSSCPKEYVERIIQNLDFPLLKKNLSQVLQIRIDDGHCHKLTDESQFSTLNWFTMFVLCSIFALSVFSTCYEILRKNPESESILSPFSLIDNAREIFSGQKSDRKNTSIKGFRAINSFLVVINHLCVTPLHANIQNLKIHGLVLSQTKVKSPFFQLTYNAVDSFLALAGALTVIKFMKTVQKRKEYDPVWEIIQRHIRFTTPIAIMLLIRMGISEHLHVGPIYSLLNEHNRKNCPRSVYAILFGYENFQMLYTAVRPWCFPQLWHVALDIQLFAFSQVILIAALWKKQLLWILPLVFCILTAIVTFLIAYVMDFGPTLTISRPPESMNYDYTMPHTRGIPWFAGMFLGYLIVRFQNRRPNNKISALMWISTLLSLSAVYFGVELFDFHDYQQPAAALYLSGHRVLWAFACSWIIYTLYENISGPMGRILSWGLFEFYGEISLEIYIVHYPLLQFLLAAARDATYVTVERTLYHFFPIMFFSTILAVTLAIFVTIPCNKILKKYSKHVKISPIQDHKQL